MKWSFTEENTMCGISAMYDATRSKTDEEMLLKGYSLLDKKLWDSRKGFEGYYETAAMDWSSANGKSMGATIDPIISFVETLSLLKQDKYVTRFSTLADNIAYVTKSMDGRKFGFLDMYDSDWKPQPPQKVTNSGNLLKPAWCLARAYLVDPKAEYKAAAEKLINQILNGSAYDKKNGGGYTEIDPATGVSQNNKKSWWELEQAVLSGLTNYYISNNKDYLKMADESMDFYMNHMYDPKYGEVFGDTDEDGSNPSPQKGNYWKGGYHSIELLYYTYLYGNLMVQNKPATLYYSLSSENEARQIPLKPISLGDKKKLTIKSVIYDGKEFKSFDSENCMLNLPANVGGEFKVTFEAVKN
jgi:mannose/cellobiose epimerase-like protein (N-acyl-D-glucosamine 2-epimerase family)